MENKSLLPKNSDLIEVVDGYHSQFGYLGKLLADEAPEINLVEQQSFTLKVLTDFFNKVERAE